MQCKFIQVNVFSPDPKRGNPLAIIYCDHLSAEDMQQVANWTNVSETVFIGPPKSPSACYAMRIFSPIQELQFGGHPTLGAAHTFIRGDEGELLQECGIGLVEVSKSNGMLFFKVPAVQVLEMEPKEYNRTLKLCGITESKVVDKVRLISGPDFNVLLLDSYETLVSIAPDWSAVGDRQTGLAAKRSDGQLEVRMLMNSGAEDPICGSLNGALGRWLIRSGRMPAQYSARQGRCLGRDGVVRLETRKDGLWCGGHVQTIIVGEIDI